VRERERERERVLITWQLGRQSAAELYAAASLCSSSVVSRPTLERQTVSVLTTMIVLQSRADHSEVAGSQPHRHSAAAAAVSLLTSLLNKCTL